MQAWIFNFRTIQTGHLDWAISVNLCPLNMYFSENIIKQCHEQCFWDPEIFDIFTWMMGKKNSVAVSIELSVKKINVKCTQPTVQMDERYFEKITFRLIRLKEHSKIRTNRQTRTKQNKTIEEKLCEWAETNTQITAKMKENKTKQTAHFLDNVASFGAHSRFRRLAGVLRYSVAIEWVWHAKAVVGPLM